MSEISDNQGYVATILEEHLFSSLGNQTWLIFFTQTKERDNRLSSVKCLFVPKTVLHKRKKTSQEWASDNFGSLKTVELSRREKQGQYL